MRLCMIAFCFVEHQLRIEGFRFEASDPVDSSKSGGSFRDCIAGSAALSATDREGLVASCSGPPVARGEPKAPTRNRAQRVCRGTARNIRSLSDGILGNRCRGPLVKN